MKTCKLLLSAIGFILGLLLLTNHVNAMTSAQVLNLNAGGLKIGMPLATADRYLTAKGFKFTTAGGYPITTANAIDEYSNCLDTTCALAETWELIYEKNDGDKHQKYRLYYTPGLKGEKTYLYRIIYYPGENLPYAYSPEQSALRLQKAAKLKANYIAKYGQPSAIKKKKDSYTLLYLDPSLYNFYKTRYGAKNVENFNITNYRSIETDYNSYYKGKVTNATAIFKPYLIVEAFNEEIRIDYAWWELKRYHDDRVKRHGDKIKLEQYKKSL